MQTCDVLIVGGGPGGSACARELRQAGADVVVIDKAVFPRDKVCAGWITPQVVTDLALDVDEYAAGRTLQAIRAFRTGVIGRHREVTTTYERAVSYGIRRCEFDHYLLKRSGARLWLGEAVRSVRRDGTLWIVNEQIAAPMLVGAGGHFCPIARRLNPDERGGAVVAAQEAEFPIDPDDRSFAMAGDTPELYFAPALTGYGWCFRKEGYLNIGLGLLDRHACSAATRSFVSYLARRRRIPADGTWRWRGHAYLLAEPRTRQVVDEAALLIGDAAGLAYPQSGEGIRPAIESGMMAARSIGDAAGRYSRDRLAAYELALTRRFGSSAPARWPVVPASVTSALGAGLMRVPAFVRHVVLDQWFLRSAEPAFTP
jgi:geranylgeranyl reductase family protein